MVAVRKMLGARSYEWLPATAAILRISAVRRRKRFPIHRHSSIAMIPAAQRPIVASASARGIPRFGDEDCIDVTALQEVDRWTEALGVSEAELRIAVANVGDSARDVREHLGR